MTEAPARPQEGILRHVGHTPLVALRVVAHGLPVPVLAKCEFLNPGGSIKDRIAVAIIDEAERRGELAPGSTIIEATAGNTGMGLALVASVRGYRVACVMPEKMSEDKRRALRMLGAEVIVTPNAAADHPDYYQNVARRIAAERGWFLADQFRNPANPRIHELETGAEIAAQVDGRVHAFVAGAGTGGTITGVGRCLKARDARTRVVLADPVGSALASWVNRGEAGEDLPYVVEGIGGGVVPATLDLSVVDEAETVSDEEAFAMTRRLIRDEGLLVGGSSGAVVVAALRVAARARAGDGAVVTILADSWDRYFSKGWLEG